jgi:hypothetical protein
MLDNPDVGSGQTTDTASHACDFVLLLIIDLLALIVHVNERVAGIVPIGAASEPQLDRTRPSPRQLITMWTAL